MKRKLMVVGLGLIVVLAAVFGFKAFKAMIIQRFVSHALPAQTTVTAEKVTQAFWEPQLHAVGSARATQAVDVAPEVGGRVTTILFQSGQRVKKNQVLVQLNSDVLETQLMSAQAKYDYTKVTYERQLELFRQNVGQRQAVDQSLTDMNQAKASIEQIKAQLDQLQIKAPFDGVLGLRYVDVGQYVTPGQKLVNLQKLNPMDVEFAVPEADLGQLNLGEAVSVTTLTYPDKVFSGKIAAFDSQIGATARALMVRASVDNQREELLPNMFLEVTVHLPGGQSVLVVPQTAINYSQIGNFVYLAINNTATKRYVEVGERRDDQIAILKGVEEGDIVITTGQLKLHDGAPITIQEDTPSQEKPAQLSVSEKTSA